MIGLYEIESPRSHARHFNPHHRIDMYFGIRVGVTPTRIYWLEDNCLRRVPCFPDIGVRAPATLKSKSRHPLVGLAIESFH